MNEMAASETVSREPNIWATMNRYRVIGSHRIMALAVRTLETEANFPAAAADP